ncbi:hypothetical protein HNQ59_003956, partial [Chitinivorax tropicus]|nr:hypothetical protein [Chitinivorax tropicus]
PLPEAVPIRHVRLWVGLLEQLALCVVFKAGGELNKKRFMQRYLSITA